MKQTGFRSWVELSRENAEHNVKVLRSLVGDRIICSAVKANAYGHGLAEMGRLLVEGGVDWLAVDCLEEALLLRENDVKVPIYIMGYTRLDDLETVVDQGFNFVVYNPETFERLNAVTQKLGKPALTHLKLETGTNRQGVMEGDLEEIARFYKENERLELIGAATHFANIEDTTNHEYAQQQFAQFEKMLGMLADFGLKPKYRHCANSAAVILFPHTHLDFVRPGIANYGMWPSRETFVTAQEQKRDIELKPVLEWKTRVAEVKHIPKGSTISYGRTFETKRDSVIAVLPIGYSNGFPRSLSNQAHVLIGGEMAPVAGRVMMNMVVVDVTDIPGVQVEDEVVIIGKQGNKRITAEDVAALEGTINYETTTMINPATARLVV
ncbi:alanine racemase [Candidatus Peregrinibacteria bacterium]|nr:alanine racemase [Candidatus Peregrinibacteria bacterium]